MIIGLLTPFAVLLIALALLFPWPNPAAPASKFGRGAILVAAILVGVVIAMGLLAHR